MAVNKFAEINCLICALADQSQSHFGSLNTHACGERKTHLRIVTAPADRSLRVMTRIAHLNNLNCDSSSCEGGSTSSAAAGKTNGHATPGDMSEVMGSSCEDEDLAMSAAAATPAVFNRGKFYKINFTVRSCQ